MLRQSAAKSHDEAGITEYAFIKGTSDPETGGGPPEQRVF